MMTYGELNLKKVRDDNGLDFAHWTYKPRQCSCCYGPKDLPDRYWAKGRKPTPENPNTDYTYILFKNADNGSGHKAKKDIICQSGSVCISWDFPMKIMDSVLDSLYEQLDDDYVLLKPTDELTTIIITTQDRINDHCDREIKNGYCTIYKRKA